MKAELDAAAAEEAEAQAELFEEPLSAEELAQAQERLGAGAGVLTVLREARERRRGRPKGARNKRTADTIAYLSQFGPDPAVAAMKIIGEDELAMVALSGQVDPAKKRMSFAEARGLRIRCIETMMPYFHGKQPVQVDATIRGVLVREEIGELKPARGSTIENEVLGVLPVEGDGGVE